MIFGKGMLEKFIAKLDANAEQLESQVTSDVRGTRVATVALTLRVLAQILREVMDE